MNETLVLVLILGATIWWYVTQKDRGRPQRSDLSGLPERFVVFDFETTGLDPARHEIIEIGAIRVNRDSEHHQTFSTFVKPKRKVPKRITQLTGISHEMAVGGLDLPEALREFRDFVGDLPMVAFNAEFDDAFLRASCASASAEEFRNEVCCALVLARRAWPGRTSYRLADLARDMKLSMDSEHRALGDCQRTMIVYCAAASTVGSYR